jgi:acetate---CoA ligase (ADP-forming)
MTVIYPAHREAHVALRDGSTVHVRPVRPTDEEPLLAFFRSLSEVSFSFRFFSPAVSVAAIAHQESHVDYVNTYGLVATAGPTGRFVGHAYYAAMEGNRAEVALAVADEYQGRGLGTILVGHLAEVAAASNIHVFEAEVLPANHRMLGVFRASGFPLEVHVGPDAIHITFPTALSGGAIERFEQREQTAAANALTAALSPRAVAVVGASRQRGTVGGEIFHNLLASEFAGPVYPINPASRVVQSVRAYASIEDVPDEIDLAVIAVPARRVMEAAEQCGRKGVRALVVVSAGFAELGEEGREREAALLDLCRTYGMRLFGPNCLGILNTNPSVRLNATFGPSVPPPGRLGFASQSGALGLAVVEEARSLGLGISSFVSMGNKADISGNDLLNYWETDGETDVILLYLESLGNPRKFSRIARRVGQLKPIVVVKSGRGSAGARASSSHTGALVAASDVTVDALFRQAGVIRTDTLAEMFGVATLLAHQPLPTGRRVGIVSNVGGPAILCADACEGEGLEVPVLSESTQSQLREMLPAEASAGNPVDMLATATAEEYRRAIELVAADSNVDAVIAIFIRPLTTRPEAVAGAIMDATRRLERRKPVLAVFMGTGGVSEALRSADASVPSYAFPEPAAIALAHAVRHAEWRQRPQAAPPHLRDLRRDEAAALVAEALGRGADWLEPEVVGSLLSCYGVPTPAQRIVTSPEAAAEAAETLNSDVALKAIAPDLVHKTELGAVQLRLRGAREVHQAARQMADRLAAAGHPPTGFLVQQMVSGGVEMLVGIVHDPQFGPVIACGAGGILAELLKDVSVRLTPVTRQDATEMVHALRTFPLLTGYRGGPVNDVAALEEVLLRIGAMAEDLPQIAELDCNPVTVLEHGAVVVDARIRLQESKPPPPLGARREMLRQA